MERLGHASGKRGLRNDLAFPYGQWAISIRLICILGENKLVSRHGKEGLEHALVCDSRGENRLLNKSLSCLRKRINFAHCVTVP